MPFSKLLQKELIKKFKVASSQVKTQIDLAERDLSTARSLLKDKRYDWSYNISYNAVLQATRGLMFSEGYRPANEAQHKTAIEFVGLSLGRRFEDEIRFFDKMRVKRHQAVYDKAGIISESEARQALDFADKFVGMLTSVLNERGFRT